MENKRDKERKEVQRIKSRQAKLEKKLRTGRREVKERQNEGKEGVLGRE